MGFCSGEFSLELPVALSRSGGGGLLCDLTSLTDPRRVFDFHFVWPFSYCESEMKTF